MTNEKLVVVFEGSFDEGEVVSEVLDSNGINSFLDGKSLSVSAMPVLGSGCRIEVLEADAARAMDVLKSVKREPVTDYMSAPMKKFFRDAAGPSPAPGGGSVAALAAGLGTTMAAMASNFAIGKKKYAEFEGELIKTLNEIHKYGEELIGLVQEDIEVYNRVTDAFGLPKETPEEKEARSAAIQSAMKVAMEVPLETVRFAARALGHLPRLAEIGNPNLASDVGVAALMLEAGMQGAVLNVKINLASIKDESVVRVVTKELETIVPAAVKNKEAALAKVNDIINNKK